MKTVKNLFAAIFLAFALGTAVYACGDMSMPPCPCGEIGQPACPGAADLSSDTDLGEMSTPPIAPASGDIDTSTITEAALDMFLMALMLY